MRGCVKPLQWVLGVLQGLFPVGCAWKSSRWERPGRHLSWLLWMRPLQPPSSCPAYVHLILNPGTIFLWLLQEKCQTNLNFLFSNSEPLFTHILRNRYFISCKRININFPLHSCSRYFWSFSKQRWRFAEPTRFIGKQIMMHGMWARLKLKAVK